MTGTADRPISPAEWAHHDSVWIGWPSADDLWQEDIGPAREQVADFIKAIILPDDGDTEMRGEHVNLACRGDSAMRAAQTHLADLIADKHITLVDLPIGDIWLRDTAPVFTRCTHRLIPTVFQFNGWGGKYLLPSDDQIAMQIARSYAKNLTMVPMILEGGSIDTDGQGTALTTRECLLNKNRNPDLSQGEIETHLREALGIETLIWLEGGLVNDHTDGHIDNIARFIAPGKVVCMRPTGADDPNGRVYADILRALDGAKDHAGHTLDIVEIPSPGLVCDKDGNPVPASHVNFYIANHSVIMPVYAQTDEQHEAAELALSILSDHIDREHFHGLDARAILTGGGAFHCISQQVPGLSVQDAQS